MTLYRRAEAIARDIRKLARECDAAWHQRLESTDESELHGALFRLSSARAALYVAAEAVDVASKNLNGLEG